MKEFLITVVPIAVVLFITIALVIVGIVTYCKDRPKTSTKKLIDFINETKIS
jgi:hypothetical protein